MRVGPGTEYVRLASKLRVIIDTLIMMETRPVNIRSVYRDEEQQRVLVLRLKHDMALGRERLRNNNRDGRVFGEFGPRERQRILMEVIEGAGRWTIDNGACQRFL